MRRDNYRASPARSPRLRATVVSAFSFLANMTSSEIPSRLERIRWLPIGWHEYPAQRLEARGMPGLEDDGDDDPEAEPAERSEMQQVCQLVGARMKDAPQREQEQHDGRGRHEQMPPQPELVTELSPERADDRDVNRQVDQYDCEPADAGDIAECA